MPSVELRVDGQRIAGHIVHPPPQIRRIVPARSSEAFAADGRHPGVLLVHGWGGNQRPQLASARRLSRQGLVCLTLNLRGHVETRHHRDRVSREQNLRDLLVGVDRLCADPAVDPRRIGLVGSSYGGYLAVLLTAERPVLWLGLQAPALYKDEGFDRPKVELNRDPDLERYRRQRHPPEDNLALATAARFAGDVLIVESERDDVIPRPVIESYRQAFAGARSVTHELMERATHGIGHPEERQRYTDILVGWFAARLAEGVDASRQPGDLAPGSGRSNMNTQP